MEEALFDCWQLFEANAIGLKGYDLVDLIVEVLQLLA